MKLVSLLVLLLSSVALADNTPAFILRDKHGQLLVVSTTGDVIVRDGVTLSEASMRFWENLGVTYANVTAEVDRLRAENVALRAMCRNKIKVHK